MEDFFKELFKVISLKAIAYLLSSVVIAGGAYSLLKTDEPNNLNEEKSDEGIKIADSKNSTLSRKPSSTFKEKSNNISSPLKSSKAIITQKNESNFTNSDNPTEYLNTRKTKDFSDNAFSAPPLPREFNNQNIISSALIPEVLQKTLPPNATNNENTFSGSSFKKPITPQQDIKKTASIIQSAVTSSGGGGGNIPENACSTNVLSGSFGNPFGVTINCTYLSKIKYCLAKDTCCDPNTSGTSYTTPVVIGKENGNFCLSFYGESQVGGDSEVVQNNYTVNSTFPNLTVGMPQTFYQTTELEGTTFIASTDFGKADYSAGQINFKSNDPGASGLGYDCQEIVEDDHSSLTPMPISTLFNFDVSLASPSSQIQIPFREDKIDYGINYITSYIKNNNYVAPLYSCSTGTITLEDFDYFEADDAQSVAGDNNLREFEGQFQSYGFFEADAQVFRGPAGISSEELNGTYLKSGLFSVFY